MRLRVPRRSLVWFGLAPAAFAAVSLGAPPAQAEDGAGAPALRLAAKIEPLLTRLESDGNGAAQGQAAQDAEVAVRAAGLEALPILERALRDGTPRRAQFVASLAQRAFGTAAIPMLERVMLEGDGVARGAAWQAIAGLKDSPDLRALLDRLAGNPALRERHDEVVALLAARLDDAERLRHYDAGGPDAAVWLKQLLAHGSPDGLRRAIALGRDHPDDARKAIVEALTTAPAAASGLVRLEAADLDELTAFLTRGAEGAVPSTVFGTLAVARWRLALPADPETRRTAAEGAWRRFAVLPADQRAPYGVALSQAGMAIPASLFADAAWSDAFFGTLAAIGTQVPFNNLLLSDDARSSAAPLWPAVARAVARADEQQAARTLEWAVSWSPSGPRLPPAALSDASWVRVLERTSLFERNPQPYLAFVAAAAAQSGDPAFAGIARSWITRPNFDTTAWSGALARYRGPDRVDLWAVALEQPIFASGNVGTTMARAAIEKALLDEARSLGLEKTADLVRRLRRDTPAAAARLVDVLVEMRARAAVAALADDEAKAESPSPAPVRSALLRGAGALHLREAMPLLLREYEEGMSAEAAKVIASIREYHDRLAEFRGWARGDTGSSRDVSDLLKDGDPEIRRAAVLALAATGGKDALPALVRFAKEEKDARVRQAALDAVERVAKLPQAPSPVPAPEPEKKP